MNTELYHYGVRGMKWGVRKSKEERLSNWKNKQHTRLDKQTERDQTKWNKKIAKAEATINKKGSTKERDFELRKLKGKRALSKVLNETGHDLINGLTQKDYNGIVKTQAVATGMSVASMALMATGNLPVAYLHIPSTNLNFRDYRVKHSDLESPDTIS